MKIRQAPIAGLIKYLEKLYDERPKDFRTSNIINVVNKYYCSLTNHKTIIPPGNDIMNDWCDLNWSNDMKTCPNIPGLIVYKNKPDGSRFYGVLYHGGYITTPDKQTNFLSYFFAHHEGRVGAHSFHIDDWDGWGAPIRYFSFNTEDYIDTRFWELGERELSFGSFGHDVRQLQGLLQKMFVEIEITSIFDEMTLNALQSVQKLCNIPITENFDCSNTKGQRVIEFLAEKNNASKN